MGDYKVLDHTTAIVHGIRYRVFLCRDVDTLDYFGLVSDHEGYTAESGLYATLYGLRCALTNTHSQMDWQNVGQEQNMPDSTRWAAPNGALVWWGVDVSWSRTSQLVVVADETFYYLGTAAETSNLMQAAEDAGAWVFVWQRAGSECERMLDFSDWYRNTLIQERANARRTDGT